eukprot:4064795-Pyramimonas_sp.AAC.1
MAPRAGIVPATASRGRRIWVAPGQCVLSASRGFFSAGAAGRLLVDCAAEEHRTSERAARNRIGFQRGSTLLTKESGRSCFLGAQGSAGDGPRSSLAEAPSGPQHRLQTASTLTPRCARLPSSCSS